MKIANFSVERPVAISMLILAIVFVGLYALPNLGVSLMPTMSMPMATITTSYTGAAPAEVEKIITKPIESSVSFDQRCQRNQFDFFKRVFYGDGAVQLWGRY